MYIGLAATWGILAGLLWTHSALAEIQAGVKAKGFTLAQQGRWEEAVSHFKRSGRNPPPRK